jgi:hypothetical protein
MFNTQDDVSRKHVTRRERWRLARLPYELCGHVLADGLGLACRQNADGERGDEG